MHLDQDAYTHCQLCPRRCGVSRADGEAGACGCTDELMVSRAALHFWEEPPISGDTGSGTIFFSGCPLRCVFCQNHEISHGGRGTPITTSRLSRIMIELQEQGAANVNLVTPLHYAPHVAKAIVDAKAHGLSIPIVCNTSGYESPDVVRAVGELVDVWLTDFKYASKTVAHDLSRARDYPSVATAALREMLRQMRDKGGRTLSAEGVMQRGVIVRHLVLPGHVDDSFRALDMVWDECGNDVDVSVMSQYTPNETCRSIGGPLSRTLDHDEYDLVVCHADDLGFEHIWWQDGAAADESFIPPFDDTGVRGPEL